MSEPVIVYKALRQISEWTLSTFYSEVTVRGQENIPQNGPLIICSSHHNEIIDIATLAVTIPHQRPVSFWAKSSMFKNPVSRFIMGSSGAIPVMRNPNSRGATPDGTRPSESTAPTADSLFSATTRALLDGRVIGVFPEGTSYTEPRIMQVKEGAALAALEFVRADKAKWEAEEEEWWEKAREEWERIEKEQREAKEKAEREYEEWMLNEVPRLEAEAREARERQVRAWEEWQQLNEMARLEAEARASEQIQTAEEMEADMPEESEFELQVDVQAETYPADETREREERQEFDVSEEVNGEQGGEWQGAEEQEVGRAEEENIQVGLVEKIEEEAEIGTAIIIDTPTESVAGSAVGEENEFTSEMQITEAASLDWTPATTGVENGTPLQGTQSASYAPQYSWTEPSYSYPVQQEWQPYAAAQQGWQSNGQSTQQNGGLVVDSDHIEPKAAPKERPPYTAGLSLVPVGIVYTDKSQYLSRIVVSYGAPIPIDRYLSDYLDPQEDSTPHAAVERLTAEINSRMLELTIDAPDWDTHQACQMVRDILWPDDDMHLWNFPDISQTIVDIFSPENASEEQERVKKLLLHYSALLQYANMTHGAASASLFYEYSDTVPTVLQTLRVLILRVILAFLDPRFILFVPSFILHLPVYGTSLLASRLLANQKLSETISQYKVIFGGAAMGAVYSWCASVAFKCSMSWSWRFGHALGNNRFLLAAVNKIPAVDLHGWEGALGRVGGILGRVARVVGVGATAAAAVFLIAKSHKYFVKGNLKRFRRLTACAKVFVGLASPASFSLPLDKVNAYFARPPIPPHNPFVKYETLAEERRSAAIPFIFSPRLIRHILDTRHKTMTGLIEYLVKQPWGTRSGPVDAARVTTLCEARYLRRKFENHAAIFWPQDWARALVEAEDEDRDKSD